MNSHPGVLRKKLWKRDPSERTNSVIPKPEKSNHLRAY